MTIILDTSDIDAANEAFNAMYGRMRLTVSDGEHHARVTRELVGDAELHRAAFTMRFDADVEPLGALMFARVLHGTVTFESRWRQNTYAKHDVFLMARPDESYRAAMDALDVEFAVLPLDRITTTVGALAGHSTAPFDFIGYRPANRTASLRWNRCFDFVRQTAAATAGNPLLAESISYLLASTALATFPNTAQREPTIEDRHDAHPLTLRRAMAFIEENAHRPINVADIAAAASVTARAVQLAFRRHLNTTPMRYLRQIRLTHAHQDLRNTEPADTTTIAMVAARWGFHDHRNIATAHRQSYGAPPQPPSEGHN